MGFELFGKKLYSNTCRPQNKYSFQLKTENAYICSAPPRTLFGSSQIPTENTSCINVFFSDFPNDFSENLIFKVR